ncbi:MAG: hypothetical protein IT320_28160 [Anaerolineae bacterium]|nr:hypothetical protein [Anaerolineae bacterium]
MKKHSFVIVFASLVLMLVGAVLVAAQDDAASPNNLCDEGQLWGDGRCNIPEFEGATERAWQCGWYMARVLYEDWSTDQVPADCSTIVPTGGSELCRSLDDELETSASLCLRSDQTGTLSASGDDSLVLVRLVQNEPATPEDCPATEGYTVVTVVPTTFFESFYTAQELESQPGLGLMPFACLYMADTP